MSTPRCQGGAASGRRRQPCTGAWRARPPPPIRTAPRTCTADLRNSVPPACRPAAHRCHHPLPSCPKVQPVWRALLRRHHALPPGSHVCQGQGAGTAERLDLCHPGGQVRALEGRAGEQSAARVGGRAVAAASAADVEAAPAACAWPAGSGASRPSSCAVHAAGLALAPPASSAPPPPPPLPPTTTTTTTPVSRTGRRLCRHPEQRVQGGRCRVQGTTPGLLAGIGPRLL